MGRCRGEACMCVQCLGEHVPPFSRVFQGLPDKKFDSLSWWHKFLVDDPLTVKNKILDLLILAYLGQGEFAVCHSRISRFVSGSYSKIHDSSSAITLMNNSGSLSRRSRRSRPPTDLLLSREVLWNHLGPHFSHVQILC